MFRAKANPSRRHRHPHSQLIAMAEGEDDDENEKDFFGSGSSLAGARTVSVRSTFDDESDRRIFKAPPQPPAANRDGSRSVHFKLTRCHFFRRLVCGAEFGHNIRK
jgi:hypothetical protein